MGGRRVGGGREVDTYISTLFVVLDATGVDKELADGLEGAITVFTEVEVVIG